jgi:hypothetical protein
LKVNIVYLSYRKRENMDKAMEILSSQVGPLKFNLLEFSNKTKYFNFHSNLKRISLEDLRILSSLVREEVDITNDDFVVIVSAKPLNNPNKKLKTIKDWVSFYSDRNIIIKSSGWEKVTDNKPSIGIAHQIVENIFQNLSQVDLESLKLNEFIHMDVEVCVNDFCEKTIETRSKIRSGYICQPCIESALSYTSNDYVIQIKNILSEISNRVRENYVFKFDTNQLKVEVSNNFEINIGGQKIDFGHKGKMSHVVYLFFLLNNRVGIGKKDLSENGSARDKFISLYNHLYKKVYPEELNSYVNNITSVHSRISNRIKNTLNIEALAYKYGFSSRKINQDVTVYSIDVSIKNLYYPLDLKQFIIT